MPLIDVKCQAKTCGVESEAYRPVSDWPKTPPCETCGSETKQTYNPSRSRHSIDPIVVFEAPDGSFRFPGDSSGLSVRRYEKLGYHRVEIRSATDMRRFEKKMNHRERGRMERSADRKQAVREAREHVSRARLRESMQSMSAFGRDVATAAMAKNDAKPVDRNSDPGFHSEVFSYDRSNRDESRDDRGRRRRD